jgi:hypothetical protein
VLPDFGDASRALLRLAWHYVFEISSLKFVWDLGLGISLLLAFRELDNLSLQLPFGFEPFYEFHLRFANEVLNRTAGSIRKLSKILHHSLIEVVQWRQSFQNEGCDVSRRFFHAACILRALYTTPQ